jgi:hypothetical protein
MGLFRKKSQPKDILADNILNIHDYDKEELKSAFLEHIKSHKHITVEGSLSGSASSLMTGKQLRLKCDFVLSNTKSGEMRATSVDAILLFADKKEFFTKADSTIADLFKEFIKDWDKRPATKPDDIDLGRVHTYLVDTKKRKLPATFVTHDSFLGTRIRLASIQDNPGRVSYITTKDIKGKYTKKQLLEAAIANSKDKTLTLTQTPGMFQIKDRIPVLGIHLGLKKKDAVKLLDDLVDRKKEKTDLLVIVIESFAFLVSKYPEGKDNYEMLCKHFDPANMVSFVLKKDNSIVLK